MNFAAVPAMQLMHLAMAAPRTRLLDIQCFALHGFIPFIRQRSKPRKLVRTNNYLLSGAVQYTYKIGYGWAQGFGLRELVT